MLEALIEELISMNKIIKKNDHFVFKRYGTKKSNILTIQNWIRNL